MAPARPLFRGRGGGAGRREGQAVLMVALAAGAALLAFMFVAVLAVVVGARIAWALSSPKEERRAYVRVLQGAQRSDAQQRAGATKINAVQEAARVRERFMRAAATPSTAHDSQRGNTHATTRLAAWLDDTQATAQRPFRGRSLCRARMVRSQVHSYSELDTDTDGEISDTDTDDVSIISHPHGRERRAERSVSRSELQAAVKHGRKTPGKPGRKGRKRWRFE